MILWSCDAKETEMSVVEITQEYGYNFVILDSDGDEAKDDIAKLTCLGMSGGYGAFRLEGCISGKKNYTKTFDSEEYSTDEQTYNFPRTSIES